MPTAGRKPRRMKTSQCLIATRSLSFVLTSDNRISHDRPRRPNPIPRVPNRRGARDREVFVVNENETRIAFEKWVSTPPFEYDCDRWPNDESKHAWPGQYKDISVQLAWEAWKESQNKSLTTPSP